MPQKCLTCDFIGRTDENPDCPRAGECNFHEVPTYHYAKQGGVGRPIAKTQDKDGVYVTLNLDCASDNPEATAIPYLPAVTCLTCLANNPKKEE